MYRNTIGRKITRGYVLMAGLLVVAALFTIIMIEKTTQSTKQIYQYNRPILFYAQEILSAIHESQDLSQQWVNSRDKNLIERRHQLWEGVIYHNIDRVDLLLQQDVTSAYAEQHEHWQMLERKLNVIKTEQDQLEQYVMLDGKDELQKDIVRTKQQLSAVLSETIETLKIMIDSESIRMETALIDNASAQEALIWIEWILLAIGLLAAAISTIMITRMITRPVHRALEVAQDVAEGNFDHPVELKGFYEIELLGNSMAQMQESLRELTRGLKEEAWEKQGENELYDHMEGEQELPEIGKSIIDHVVRYVNGQVGVIYFMEGSGVYHFLSSYGVEERSYIPHTIQPGQGMIGEVLDSKQISYIDNIPVDYLASSTALGGAMPGYLALLPIMYENEVIAFIEMAKFQPFSAIEKRFLERVCDLIGSGLFSAFSREKLRVLYHEMQAQQEQLKKSNQALKSEQDKLAALNHELEDKTHHLEERNKEIEQAKRVIDEKAKALELANKYKSDFLANMSHELRTPLNSMLILTRSFCDNEKKNLTKEQVEEAHVIYNGGKELLELVNDILDMSKVEAGKLEIHSEDIEVEHMLSDLQKQFAPIAKEKGLEWQVKKSAAVPSHICTDILRLKQILKNLLSNAFKFTEDGGVILELALMRQEQIAEQDQRGERDCKYWLALSVIDNGIGIEKEKLLHIFEAFTQEDSSTTRKFGGTGLGLSISAQMAQLLGGHIGVRSKKNMGSCFTLYLALPELDNAEIACHGSDASEMQSFLQWASDQHKAYLVQDDRSDISDEDAAILVIERNTESLIEIMEMLHQKGFKVLAASSGKSAIRLLNEFHPQGIIIGDRAVDMGSMNLYGLLKQNMSGEQVPVHHYLSDNQGLLAFNNSFSAKPCQPINSGSLAEALRQLMSHCHHPVNRVLALGFDATLWQQCHIAGEPEVRFEQNLERASRMVCNEEEPFDLVIYHNDMLQQKLTGWMASFAPDMLQKLLPIMVFSEQGFTEALWREYASIKEAVIVCGLYASNVDKWQELEHFADQVKQVRLQYSKSKAQQLEACKSLFKNKKILISDDDMRSNIALTKELKKWGMTTTLADSGEMAVELLERERDIDLVIMDVHVPNHSGNEPIRAIHDHCDLPIVALSTKVQKEEKQQAMREGACAFLLKPLDIHALLSVMMQQFSNKAVH